MLADPAHLAAFCALAAAACWSITPLLAANVNAALGGFGFARWRTWCAVLLLALMTALHGGWREMTGPQFWEMVWSGAIGVFIGDTLLFACMGLLGPRRSGLLFSTHAAMTAALAAAVLGERLTPVVLGGIACVTAGVMLATFFGKSRGNAHAWEADAGKLSLGVALGLLSALGQAVGAILAKPAMDSGVDPVAGSAVRLLAASVCHIVAILAFPKLAALKTPMTPQLLGRTLLVAFMGMGMGMTLFLTALAYGEAGWVSVLSSISTILILPLLWIFFRKPPPAGAWVGAALGVFGTALIILNVGG